MAVHARPSGLAHPPSSSKFHGDGRELGGGGTGIEGPHRHGCSLAATEQDDDTACADGSALRGLGVWGSRHLPALAPGAPQNYVLRTQAQGLDAKRTRTCRIWRLGPGSSGTES